MEEKQIRFTPHAEENLITRSIARSDAVQAIRFPEREEEGRSPRRVASKQYFDELLKKEMLLRVIYEEDESTILVVTLYKTSKITKYLVP